MIDTHFGFNTTTVNLYSRLSMSVEMKREGGGNLSSTFMQGIGQQIRAISNSQPHAYMFRVVCSRAQVIPRLMHDETTCAGKKRSLEGAELVLDRTAKEPIIT